MATANHADVPEVSIASKSNTHHLLIRDHRGVRGGDIYELVLCSPVAGLIPSRRLHEASRTPDASDLRVRGGESEIKRSVKTYAQKVTLESHLSTDSFLIESKESIAIFGRNTRNHHIQIYASLEHIRFSTENVLYEKSHEHDVFFDGETVLYRDRLDGFLFTRLGAFPLRGKRDSDGT